MAAKKKKSNVVGLNPADQIRQYLSDNKEYHNDFAEEIDYVVSSGSLLLDMEMSGGLRPSVIRASGVAEGGKTSCALSFARNFQKMDNSMVVYVKAEGRLSKEMIEMAKWTQIPAEVKTLQTLGETIQFTETPPEVGHGNVKMLGKQL